MVYTPQNDPFHILFFNSIHAIFFLKGRFIDIYKIYKNMLHNYIHMYNMTIQYNNKIVKI